MDLPTFWDNFEVIAEAPGGVQRLRELILDLAVRGKLVPQDPADEPAGVLLEVVRQKKSELLKAGKLRQKKELKKLQIDEILHAVPNGWMWCRFGQIIDCYRGHNPPKSDFIKEPREGYVRFVQITDFKTDESAVYVPETHKLKRVYRGEIAMAAYRHIGKLSRNVEGAFNVAICKVLEIEPVSRDYIEKLIGSVYVKGELLAASGRSHIPSMHTEHLRSLVVPLPPLAEQKRIVAKVDELMALCDRYEVLKCDRNSLRTKMRASAIDALMNAETDESLNTAWEFVQGNWKCILNSLEDIMECRQIVLQFAVTGRLSTQNLVDEHPSQVLQIITEQKNKLIKEKIINKLTRQKKHVFEEVQYNLPKNWILATISDVCLLVTDGDHQPPPKVESGVPFLVIGNVSKGKLDFSSTRFTTFDYFNNLDWGKKPRKGDLLYTVTGSYGMTLFVNTEKEFCVQRHIAIIKTSKNFSTKYLKIALSSPQCRKNASHVATGIAQKTVPLSGLRMLPIPVPPVAEQECIVAKVDQLMTLCDTLATHLRETQDKATALAAAVVGQLEV